MLNPEEELEPVPQALVTQEMVDAAKVEGESELPPLPEDE
jgi:hypothetical protein